MTKLYEVNSETLNVIGKIDKNFHWFHAVNNGGSNLWIAFSFNGMHKGSLQGLLKFLRLNFLQIPKSLLEYLKDKKIPMPQYLDS